MKKLGIALIVAGVLTVVGLAFGFKKVGPNEVAVKIVASETKGVVTSGWHFELPFITRYVKMATNQQKFDGHYSTSTKDMQTITQDISTQYLIDVSKANELYSNFLGKHEEAIITPSVAEVVQSVTSKYTIEEFVAKRTEISDAMLEALKEKLSGYGINIISVDILDHDFSDSYEAAVEAKKVAEQKVQEAEFTKQAAVIEAETNKIKSEAMTPQIMQDKMIDAWKQGGSQVPNYMAGDGNLFNFLIPTE